MSVHVRMDKTMPSEIHIYIYIYVAVNLHMSPTYI